MGEDTTLQATLRLAEEVVAVLSGQGVDAVLIGAVALAPQTASPSGRGAAMTR